MNPLGPWALPLALWRLQLSALEFSFRASWALAYELWLPRGARPERTGPSFGRMLLETRQDTFPTDEEGGS